MFEIILMMLPTVLAILSIAAFNENTRLYCYTLVLFCIASELIPLQINAIALIATSTALIALLGIDIAQRLKAPRHAALRH